MFVLFLQKLSQVYSERLHLSTLECYAALSELQRNALEKLKQREHFKESGEATIKLKLLNGINSRVLTKEVPLSLPVRDFKQLISKDANVSIERLIIIECIFAFVL